MSALCSVEDAEVAEVLGFPLITKAEPYTAHPVGPDGRPTTAEGDDSHHKWMVAAVVVMSILVLVVFLAFLFLAHRWSAEKKPPFVGQTLFV